MPPVTLNDGTQLDGSVVKVLSAIRHVESSGDYNAVGDNGTSRGAFQWNNYINGQHVPLQQGQIPSNFQSAAKQFGLDPSDFSPANQNKVAYSQIAQWKSQGLTPNSIDAMWNGAKPDPSNPGQYLHVNPQRLSTFNNALQQQLGAADSNPAVPQSATTPTAPEAPPSVGGFAQNVVKSGASFLGNIGNAILHPIQTAQSIGGAAVGGLQELGGQHNDNTAKFDGLVDYFKQRYGGVDNLLHTAYTDPIGLAGDVSAALGVGGGLAGAVGKVGDLTEAGRLGTAADIARTKGIDFVAGENGVRSTAGINNPITNAGRVASDTLGRASELTNPLTPVISGIGSVLGRGGGVAEVVGSRLIGLNRTSLRDIYENPADYTPEQIAAVTRTSVGRDVESALKERAATFEDTGTHYSPIIQANPVINVSHNFLEDQFRKVAGLDVKDGRIIADSKSAVRDPGEIARLQSKFNLYKPAFQEGKISAQEYLNLRRDLDKIAYNDQGIKSSDLAGVTFKIRNNLNSAYRNQVQGLEDLDHTWATQKNDLATLRKGFLDSDGNLTQSAISKIANAGNKDIELERLEKIVPGITRRLQVLKVIEDIQKVQKSSGGFTAKLAEGGALISGAVTGNIHLVAGALAAAIVASPGIAIPLIRGLGGNQALISNIVAHLSKYAVYGAVARNSQSSQEPSGQLDSQPQPETDPQTTLLSSSDTAGSQATTDPQSATGASSSTSAAPVVQ